MMSPAIGGLWGHLKIRKSVLKRDLRDMPIDHGDMFLMSQTEELIDASEVAELMPWEAAETERRLSALVELGLLEWVNERGESIDRVRRDTQPDFYVAVTLRPKAPVPVADLFRQTETSVVALRALDGLLLLDQAVIHHDRSVFSRATAVKEAPRKLDGPVFATARPSIPDPEQLVHFSLPPMREPIAQVNAQPVLPKAPPPPLARHEPSVFSRATVPGDIDSEPAVMARSTLVYEKTPSPSVYERTTVVDEDAEARAHSEKASTVKQASTRRR